MNPGPWLMTLARMIREPLASARSAQLKRSPRTTLVAGTILSLVLGIAGPFLFPSLRQQGWLSGFAFALLLAAFLVALWPVLISLLVRFLLRLRVPIRSLIPAFGPSFSVLALFAVLMLPSAVATGTPALVLLLPGVLAGALMDAQGIRLLAQGVQEDAAFTVLALAALLEGSLLASILRMLMPFA